MFSVTRTRSDSATSQELILIEPPDCKNPISVLLKELVIVIKVVKLEKVFGALDLKASEVMLTVRIIAFCEITEGSNRIKDFIPVNRVGDAWSDKYLASG